MFLWCRPQPPGSPLPFPPERRELRGRRRTPPAKRPAGARGGKGLARRWRSGRPRPRLDGARRSSAPSRLLRADAAPLTGRGRGRGVPARAAGGRGAAPRPGGPWRMEPAMEPETLEARISECPGGARAGPEPEPGARGWPLSPAGAGSARPLLTPRPPGPGGAAPQFAARTLAAAQRGWERALPTHPGTGPPRATPKPRGPRLLHPRAAPRALPLRDPPLAQGLRLFTLCSQLVPGSRDGRTPGPSPPALARLGETPSA